MNKQIKNLHFVSTVLRPKIEMYLISYFVNLNREILKIGFLSQIVEEFEFIMLEVIFCDNTSVILKCVCLCFELKDESNCLCGT